jgi:hypothetical protein
VPDLSQEVKHGPVASTPIPPVGLGVPRDLPGVLGATFRTSPEFWLNAQKAVDLFQAERSLSKLPSPVLRAK